MEDFLSLRHLLEEDHLTPESLVATIDQYGIDHKFHPDKPPLKYGANSLEAFEAISLLSAYLNHKVSGKPIDIKGFIFEEFDLDRLGWMRLAFNQSHAKTKFGWLKKLSERSEMLTLWNERLHTLGRLLLMEKADIGALATAIETLGVHGIDRYGRVKWYDPASGEAQSVLDDLAWFHAEHFMLPSIFDVFVNKEKFQTFGWIHEQLPDFKSIEINHKKAQLINVRQLQAVEPDDEAPNAAKAKMTLIAGLFGLISGHLTGKPHPAFQSQTQLVELLISHIGKRYGNSETSIDQKLGEANRILNDITNQTPKTMKAVKKPTPKRAMKTQAVAKAIKKKSGTLMPT